MVLVDTFSSKAESVYLTDLLDKHDIPFIQQSEDGGGQYGSFLTNSGVKILISDEDVGKVQKIIDEARK